MRAGPQERDGTLLLRVLVGIALLGFFVAASIPTIGVFRGARRVDGAGKRFAVICNDAQALARREHHGVFVEIHTEDDVIAVVQDTNDNGLADVGETVTAYRLDAGLDLASTTLPNARLAFDAHGRATATGDVVLHAGVVLPSSSVEVPAGTGVVRFRCE